jgi:hypothetical protein
MPDDTYEILEPGDEQAIALESLPPYADEQDYLRSVGSLPLPTGEQIKPFVLFVSDAKSWYKHPSARPLDAHSRPRCWSHQIVYRDSRNTRINFATLDDDRGMPGPIPILIARINRCCEYHG